MGAEQSSHAEVEQGPYPSVRGRKTKAIDAFEAPHGLTGSIVSVSEGATEEFVHLADMHNPPFGTSIREEEDGEVTEEDAVTVESDDDYSTDDDEDSLLDEDDHDLEERLLILQDARQLKLAAEFFLHPEKPVEVEGSARGRCFFDRPSAVPQESAEEVVERESVLADAKALKNSAVNYLHPETPVVTSDATAKGRNYFSRASAVPQETEEEATEREAVLAEAKALKQLAVDFSHPENPVSTSDPSATGRNYFDRFSASTTESPEEAEERDAILQDLAALKKLAADYMHPELPVKSDPCNCGRNYFDRPSAIPQENWDEAEERAMALADAKALKQHAVDYMHPERPVEVDPTTFGRNFFERPSAAPQESEEAATERDAALSDALALKKLAVDYMHPEKPVDTDPTCFGRNYFSRPSAEPEEFEAAERDAILVELNALKKLAADYLHPERPVSVDPSACGRNYFTRPAAVEQELSEDAAERQAVLADAMALKKLAVDYMHPEAPVANNDPASYGRNYFSRPSAEPAESAEEAEERDAILAEMNSLKKLAVDYRHPELPVETDPAALGRNYFNRASAAPTETLEEADERAQILADVNALKKSAVDYFHPELPVQVDPAAFGRNYFARPSASTPFDEEEAEERENILAEAAALKQVATDFLHPEVPVQAADPTLFGRNYFGRASAPQPEPEDLESERAMILADAAALKQRAADYLHPEAPVKTTDPCAFGRSYFSRPGAYPQESEDEAAERDAVLTDAKALKKVAADYLHPEHPIDCDPSASARNYFTRANGPTQESLEDLAERELIVAEAQAMKKHATDYLHPENPVETSDPTACGRNYFSRATAPGHLEMVHTFPAHADDDDHQDHEHMDHFGMDDEMHAAFDHLRHDLAAPEPALATKSVAGAEEEGKLSRSPSSVMLFTEEAIY